LVVFGCGRAESTRRPGATVGVDGRSCPGDGVVQASRGGDWSCSVDASGVARCVGPDGDPVVLTDWPPIRQVDVWAGRDGAILCVLAEREGIWCTTDLDLSPSRERWLHIHNSGGAVLFSGSCLLKASGAVHCWTFDEAAWMGVSGAVDIVANHHVDNETNGCVKSNNRVCAAYGGNRRVRCSSSIWGAKWEAIEGSEGVVELAWDGHDVCGRFEGGRVACWDFADPVAAFVPGIHDAVGLEDGLVEVKIWRGDGCRFTAQGFSSL